MPRAIPLAGSSLAALVLVPSSALTQGNSSACPPEAFVNFETPHVHPLELDAGAGRLYAVSTADNRLEVFEIAGASVTPLFDVPVGLDPVSVRLRNAGEAWVVNHVSDTVSIVDLATRRVRATLATADEPADVVFAGSPERAFVSCSQANLVQVFDPADLALAPIDVAIDAEDPRALATSPDGSLVYAAIFESGNGSTILGGGLTMSGGFPPNVVGHPAGPYGGQNPPPNDGTELSPPQKAGNPPPPAVGLIVKEDAAGRWMDDNDGDWTDLVSGASAPLSGRPVGWDLPDHDVAVIDAATLAVSYVDRLMNVGMALAVLPDGALALVGTDCTNEVRFEPNLQGRFLRVELALVDGGGATLHDLNPHLSYAGPTIPQAERDASLGDPRGIVWNAAGTRGYVTGMGSNNVVVVDETGARVGAAPIEVGEGPTGVALDDEAGLLFVLDKFEAAISVVDVVAGTELSRTPFFDPSPQAIKTGRRHVYDTHERSGLGHIACASCHVDARMDRLAWDLGNPAGDVKPFSGNCPDGGCQDWHPMKGPMLTQTLQDIIGKEPHHWRADRTGIEEFEAAFMSLQGDDALPSPAEIQELEDFLATLHFPPNPFRNFDNTLPTNLPLPGHYRTGRFGSAGDPLPNGNAVSGLSLYRPPRFLDGVACVTCHTLPVGIGTNYELVGLSLVEIPPGPDGELHHAVVSLDGSTNVSIKIPHLRNLYERVGFETTQAANRAGFGFLHDGSVDSLARFLTEPVFAVTSDQQVANLVAFMLSFSGSDLPAGSASDLLEPPGPASRDAHAAVGAQETLVDEGTAGIEQLARLAQMVALAEAGHVGLVVKGLQGGIARGYAYAGADTFQSDRAAETLGVAALRAAAGPGSELTYTLVPEGTERRIGIDRDCDDALDRDELDAGTDPADGDDFPGARIHVRSIAFRTGIALAPPGAFAAAFVDVVDERGLPAQGVEVHADFTGTYTASVVATTDARGRARLVTPATPSATYCWTLTVTNLIAKGRTYEAGADVESSDRTGNDCGA